MEDRLLPGRHWSARHVGNLGETSGSRVALPETSGQPVVIRRS